MVCFVGSVGAVLWFVWWCFGFLPAVVMFGFWWMVDWFSVVSLRVWVLAD